MTEAEKNYYIELIKGLVLASGVRITLTREILNQAKTVGIASQSSPTSMTLFVIQKP